MVGRRPTTAEASATCGAVQAAETGFPVSRDESFAMFGLLLNFILADLAVTRAGPPVGAPPGFSPKLTRALLFLSQASRPVTVGELAEGLGISLGWASRIADDLTNSGLVDRDRDEQDRRVVQLKLTLRARAVSDRLWTDRQGAIVAALETVPPAEREALTSFIARVTEELERYAYEATSRQAVGRSAAGKLEATRHAARLRATAV